MGRAGTRGRRSFTGTGGRRRWGCVRGRTSMGGRCWHGEGWGRDTGAGGGGAGRGEGGGGTKGRGGGAGMSTRVVRELWQSASEETHGGENNGGARRVFCPANARYSGLTGLSSWANRRAFGTFESGNGADPPRGGGLAGQENTVDYITGMPDTRTEHWHAIDCEGYDKLRILWAAECIDYEGLQVDHANVPTPTAL